MKKKILIGLLTIVMCFILTGCGEQKTKLSNSIMNIDGIYLNEEYTSDEGLKQVVLFYTLTSQEENLEISSSHFSLKINENEYTAVDNAETPNLTEYYYSNIIEKVYVGNSLKVAAIYEVPDGDLVSGKEITLTDFDDYAEDILMHTDDIKKMDNLTSISLDVDKEYATKRQEEEKEKLTDADEATTNKVKNDINGYYFEVPAYIGKTYVKYKLEFIEPNRFEVTSTVSGNKISNTGTYRVTKGYIVLRYDTSDKELNAPYDYEDGEITIESPFYSNGSDKIF